MTDLIGFIVVEPQTDFSITNEHFLQFHGRGPLKESKSREFMLTCFSFYVYIHIRNVTSSLELTFKSLFIEMTCLSSVILSLFYGS